MTTWGICFNCKRGDCSLCAVEITREDGDTWKCGCKCHLPKSSNVICIDEFRKKPAAAVKRELNVC